MENLNAEQVKRGLERDIRISIDLNYECPRITYSKLRDALSLITSQEQRIGAQDMTISELRKRVEKAEHDADRYAQRIKGLAEENAEVKANWQKLKESHESACEECRAEFNRLTEENERLSTALANYDRQTELRIAEEYYTVEAYEELREENERLRDSSIDYRNIPEIQAKAKADTVRKMQERLTKEFDRMHKNNFMTPEVRQWIIDQIANEIIGDTK